MMRFIVIFLIFFKIAAAYEYKVPPSLLFSIAKVESKNIFYPYIISINSKKDLKRLKEIGIDLKKGRVIDCYNKRTCIKSTKLLIRAGITNIDLGVFQINYKYHKLPLENYFSIKKSAEYASQYIYKLAKKFDKWNWRILALYHSATPHLNREYIQRVNYYYSRIYDKTDLMLLREYRKFLSLIKWNGRIKRIVPLL